MKLLDIVDRHLKKLETIRGVDSIVKIIADTILETHEYNGYMAVNIMGAQGTGKTSLAMLILYNVYGDWDRVLDHIYFSVRDFLEDTRGYIELGIRVESVLLDDFGLYASKWRRTSDVASLLELMNIIRTTYSSIIYTYVDTSAQKFIRENARIVILLERIDRERVHGRVYRRKATIRGIVYKRITYFTFKPSSLFKDPEFREAYSIYWEKRREATLTKIHELENNLNT